MADLHSLDHRGITERGPCLVFGRIPRSIGRIACCRTASCQPFKDHMSKVNLKS